MAVDELEPEHEATLRLGTSLLRTRHTRALLGISFGLPVAGLVAVLSVLFAAADGPICPAIWTAIRYELTDSPANRLLLWTVAVLLPFGLAAVVLEARARLRITRAGLEADIPRLLGLRWLRQRAGKWTLRWADVRRVRLERAPGGRNRALQLAWSRLVIDTALGETRVAPFRWHARGAQDHRLGIADLFMPGKLDVLARVMSTPLARAFQARGITIETDAGTPAETSAGYDLSRHKGMLALVCLFFGAGAYALVDALVIRPYQLLEPLPAGPFVLVGIAAAAIAWKLGEGAPRLERAVVGAIAVAACVAATHPALLRLNALTATPETYSYLSLGGGVFRPEAGRLPAVDLSGLAVAEYWEAHPSGSRHEFTLLIGSAGFWQLELAPVYERTREFYRRRGN